MFGFPQATVTIGSARSSGLVLEHESIAAEHARIDHDAERTVLPSVDQELGVSVNDQRVERALLVEGDEIGIGPYRLGIVSRDPPGVVERSFLDAIAKAPQDDGSRVVYGDWLEEHGQHEEARFLRAQIELRGIADASSPRFQELASAIKAMSSKMSLAWRRAIARPEIENCNLQMEVRCPKNWDDLARTARPDERFCGTCQRPVIYANNLVKAQRLARAGHCLVVDLPIPRHPQDLWPPPVPVVRLAPPPPGMYLPPSGAPRRGGS